MIGLILLVIQLYIVGTTSSASCQTGKQVINCKALHLSDVPTFDVVSNYTTVYLNYNNITRVPQNAFYNISDTYELQIHLDHNNINEIDHDAFAGLENVSVHLFLRHNNLTQGLPGSLKSLRKLTFLSVDGISSLSGTVITSIASSLKHLIIGLKSFSHWPSELSNLVSLNTLEISGLTIGGIPADAFNGFQSLEILTIASSGFNSSLSAICPLVNLQTLTLNSIHVTDMLSFLPSCSQTLSSTWMVTIQNVDFPDFPDFFKTFPNLATLQVSNDDQLDFISEDTVPLNNTLTHLRLHNNKLKQIPYIVQKVSLLEVLDLSTNSIAVIEANDLGNMTNLRLLMLSSNPIRDISIHAFKLLPSLTSLSLRSIGMTDVPMGIKDAPNLKTVDLRHNPISCTCSLNWILNTRLITSLIGKCADKTDVVTYVNTKCKAP